jgi:predicted cation transporter
MVIAGLFIIIACVLVGPFLNKKIERNLEVFLFIMGLASAVISGVFSMHLVKEALIEPIKITLAVLVAGLVFKFIRKNIHRGITSILNVVPMRLFIFLMVVILGLLSSVITAIIASLVLVEIISGLKLDRKTEINLTVIACFSIGLGAVLTPIGEPLSTIAIAKLKELPGVNFWYLLKIVGRFVIPGVIAMGIVAIFFRGKVSNENLAVKNEEETYKGVLVRALKVYFFVMALIFLGSGFKPIIDRYVIILDSRILYWINMISSVLDNATLAAAEISVNMTDLQIRGVLIGLLISGGMLIPGNIPNIISAHRLKITSREWAKLGIPLGLITMVIFYLALYVF